MIWGLFHGAFLGPRAAGPGRARRAPLGAPAPRLPAAGGDGRLGVLPRRDPARGGGLPGGPGRPRGGPADALRRGLLPDAGAGAGAAGRRDRLLADRPGPGPLASAPGADGRRARCPPGPPTPRAPARCWRCSSPPSCRWRRAPTTPSSTSASDARTEDARGAVPGHIRPAARRPGFDGANPLGENRSMAPFPRLEPGWSSLVAFPEALTGWFEDHFGFRSTLVRWYGEGRYFGLGASAGGERGPRPGRLAVLRRRPRHGGLHPREPVPWRTRSGSWC